MLKKIKSDEVNFKLKFPKALLNKKKAVWVIDRRFSKNPLFENLQRKIFVTPGESLKTFGGIESLSFKFIKLNVTRKDTVISVGGGSLGDAVGFLSSVYLRGVKLIHVPTTWLAAVDSSIGGKTALNLKGFKNQIGTFYLADSTFYIKELLQSASVEDAEGEILKTLFLNLNKKWAKELFGKAIKFSDLKFFVEYKQSIVRKDFKDKKGVRALLNLGHTLGHVLELKLKLSHSEAVLYGLRFSLIWSIFSKKISTKEGEGLLEHLPSYGKKIKNFKIHHLTSALKRDKKTYLNGDIDFIFISSKGGVVERVTIEQIVSEFKRQMN